MLRPATGESSTPRMGLLPGAAGSPGRGGNNGCCCVGTVAVAVVPGGATGAAAAQRAISICVLLTTVAGVSLDGLVADAGVAALEFGVDADCFCRSCFSRA